MAELEKLALDPRVSPARVLPRHPHNQCGEDVVDRWSSGPLRVGPSSADEAAMPAQDRVRGDQAMTTQRSGQTAERGPRRLPGLPSPSVVAGWCGGGSRPRGAARGAQRPWRRTCDPAAGPARAPAGRSSTGAAVTREDHAHPSIAAGQRPGPSSGTPQVCCDAPSHRKSKSAPLLPAERPSSQRHRPANQQRGPDTMYVSTAAFARPIGCRPPRLETLLARQPR